MIQDFFIQHIQRRFARHLNNGRIFRMALRVARSIPAAGGAPVVFFKASTGIDDFSWNSAFHLLASWALRLRGVPVIYFACDHGMSRCVLGTDRDHPGKTPPCRSCVYQARTLYTGARVGWFGPGRDPTLEAALADLSVRELSRYEQDGIPLGLLVLPGLRWILRRYHLSDNEPTRFFLREYILSARNVAQKFEAFLDEVRPRAVVVFNGQFYPEAVVRHVAQRRGLRVITHEVGLQPASAFFTEGEATAYPIDIPDEFELNAGQNARLDAYLEKRFQGNFSMAGIKFWAGMKGLDEAFLHKAAGFRQIVPVFTNVIFDTSQPHANTLFEDMFTWLDLVLAQARMHRETLFVIRAHPDETRLRKASLETVAGWVAERRADEEPNIIFVPPHETLSSYELIGRSKFVLIYNSTIGLEASILGAAVLCAGKARFTQYPTVFYPASADEYRATLERFLADASIDVPADFRRNARRFLYFQLFRTSLPFGEFLETGVRTTHARLRIFDPALLAPEKSPALEAVLRGLLEDGDFLLIEGPRVE